MRVRSNPGLGVLRRSLLLEVAPGLLELSPAAIRRLARRSRELAVAGGQQLVAQGESHDSLFVLAQGGVDLTAERVGHRARVARLGPGDLFGEEVLEDLPSPLAATAAGEAVLIAVDVVALRSVVSAGSATQRQLATLAAERRRAVERALRASRPAGRRGGVVVVYSPKGGSGKTTLALNVGAACARRRPGSVILFDLALPYNHLTLVANVAPAGCLAAVAGGGEELTAERLAAAIIHHPSGFAVLPSALVPEQADQVSAGAVREALEILRSQFELVIVDTAPSMDEVTLAALDGADDVIVVSTPELTCLHDVARVLGMLNRALAIPLDSIHVVLNERSSHSPVNRETVEAVIGHPVAVEIEGDGSGLEETAMRGTLAYDGRPRSHLVHGAEWLADELQRRAAARVLEALEA